MLSMVIAFSLSISCTRSRCSNALALVLTRSDILIDERSAQSTGVRRAVCSPCLPFFQSSTQRLNLALLDFIDAFHFSDIGFQVFVRAQRLSKFVCLLVGLFKLSYVLLTGMFELFLDASTIEKGLFFDRLELFDGLFGYMAQKSGQGQHDTRNKAPTSLELHPH